MERIKIKKFLKFFTLISVSVLIVLLIIFLSKNKTKENCNVADISLRGSLVTYIPPSDFNDSGNLTVDESSSREIIDAISEANRNSKIKAILIEIDSFGGLPVAGEEVASALKHSQKPVVAFIGQSGISAAYLAATGAKIIFASKYSDVGGIGVTMSYLENVKKNQKEGLTFNQLSSGKFKDTGNPDKPLTAEEKELILRDLNIMHDDFIKTVAENRKLDIDKVKLLADGSSMLGGMALENGLIDKIGNLEEIKEYLKEMIREEPEICR